MAGIVVFGGTSEGRLLAEAFRGKKPELHICVATEYGKTLLPREKNIHIYEGTMEEKEMCAFLLRTAPDFCMDATHPYARIVTENIYEACSKTKIPYIRILRKDVQGNRDESRDNFIYVHSVEEGVDYLNNTQGNILITTGSKELEKYTAISNYAERCFARVLPTGPVLEKCRELGFEGRTLIGMQGPFSKEFNYAMIRQVDAAWLVTKSSGKEGGYTEKCEAAVSAGIKLIVIGRPKQREENAMSLEEAVCYIGNYYGIEEKNMAYSQQIYLVGMGPGNPDCVTEEAWNCIRESDCLIGVQRMIDICRKARGRNLHLDEKTILAEYKKEHISRFLQEKSFHKIAILYSGDVGFYSGAKGIKEDLQKDWQQYEVKTISGISSPAYFLNKLGVSREDVVLVSIHGKEEDLIPLIKRNQKVCTLLGTGEDVSKISQKLEALSLNNIKITIGEKLSYQQECIRVGYPQEWTGEKTEALAVALFENPNPVTAPFLPGLKEKDFIRGKVPMTKAEIRILSLAKLKLQEDSVLYDIGAGTGSVSIEAARLLHKGKVYAIEKNPEGIRLIQENSRRFGLSNLRIIEGTAPYCLMDKERMAGIEEKTDKCISPTAVFIGGSGGKLMEIVKFFRQRDSNIRFVINAVTLETLGEITNMGKEYPEYGNMEIVQVTVARSRETGKYHMMLSENPVFIISFGGKDASSDER